MLEVLRKTVRHFGNLAAYKLNAGFARPNVIYCHLTEKCNFRCRHCDIWRDEGKFDLELSDWKKIINDLKERLGEFTMTISGGEPLLCGYFWDLLDFCNNNQVTVNLNTNGSLITKESAARLFDKKLSKVEISLYSLKSEIHNNLRNADSAFARAYGAVEYLVDEKRRRPDSKLMLMVAFLLNDKNMGEAVDFIKHFTNLGVWVTVQLLDTNVPSLASADGFKIAEAGLTIGELWPKNKKKVGDVLDAIADLKKGGYLIYNRLEQFEMIKKYYSESFEEIRKLPCLCGQNNLIISNRGDAFFCFKGPSFGGLKNEKFSNVWTGEKAKNIRRQIKKCPGLCRVMNCNYNTSFLKKVAGKLCRASEI